jgi:hypothetical protein
MAVSSLGFAHAGLWPRIRATRIGHQRIQSFVEMHETWDGVLFDRSPSLNPGDPRSANTRGLIQRLESGKCYSDLTPVYSDLTPRKHKARDCLFRKGRAASGTLGARPASKNPPDFNCCTGLQSPSRSGSIVPRGSIAWLFPNAKHALSRLCTVCNPSKCPYQDETRYFAPVRKQRTV